MYAINGIFGENHDNNGFILGANFEKASSGLDSDGNKGTAILCW